MSYSAIPDRKEGSQIASNQGWSEFTELILSYKRVPSLRMLVKRGTSSEVDRLKIELNYLKNRQMSSNLLEVTNALLEVVFHSRKSITIEQI